MTAIEPTMDQLVALQASTDEGPAVMLNLGACRRCGRLAPGRLLGAAGLNSRAQRPSQRAGLATKIV